MTNLFGRDKSVISRHIKNALSEELDNSVVAKFATTAKDGKTYQVDYYNLDMIISVGYRVKIQKGIDFRNWANKVLKEMFSFTNIFDIINMNSIKVGEEYEI